MKQTPLQKITTLIDKIDSPETLENLLEEIKSYIVSRIEEKAKDQLEKSNQINEIAKRIKGE